MCNGVPADGSGESCATKISVTGKGSVWKRHTSTCTRRKVPGRRPAHKDGSASENPINRLPGEGSYISVNAGKKNWEVQQPIYDFSKSCQQTRLKGNNGSLNNYLLNAQSLPSTLLMAWHTFAVVFLRSLSCVRLYNKTKNVLALVKFIVYSDDQISKLCSLKMYELGGKIL